MSARRLYRALLSGAIALGTVEAAIGDGPFGRPASAGGEATRARIVDEYRQAASELRICGEDVLYLVIDCPRRLLLLKRGGAVVWSVPMDSGQDAGALDRFAGGFLGEDRRFVRIIRDRRLYEYSDQSPDSMLAVVSRVVRAKTDLMQRVVPGRFDIAWSGGMVLEIRTDRPGKPLSAAGNLFASFRRTIALWGRGERLVVRIDADRAITLYRAAGRGTPTILCPDRSRTAP